MKAMKQDIIGANLIMQPRDGSELRYVSGVFVQLMNGKSVVSVFTTKPSDAPALTTVANQIVRCLS